MLVAGSYKTRNGMEPIGAPATLFAQFLSAKLKNTHTHTQVVVF